MVKKVQRVSRDDEQEIGRLPGYRLVSSSGLPPAACTSRKAIVDPFDFAQDKP